MDQLKLTNYFNREDIHVCYLEIYECLLDITLLV